MKIQEIITENIFTTDYHSVMQAVGSLYQEHYGVDIWSDADTHDRAAQCLMKQHPTQEELDYIIKTRQLPERFQDVDFPISDSLMLGISGGLDDQDVQEAPASRALCTSSVPNHKLGASQLSSCKSQGYRKREGKMKYNIGGQEVRSAGKEIKGKKYGGPLPDYSD